MQISYHRIIESSAPSAVASSAASAATCVAAPQSPRLRWTAPLPNRWGHLPNPRGWKGTMIWMGWDKTCTASSRLLEVLCRDYIQLCWYIQVVMRELRLPNKPFTVVLAGGWSPGSASGVLTAGAAGAAVWRASCRRASEWRIKGTVIAHDHGAHLRKTRGNEISKNVFKWRCKFVSYYY